MLTNNFSEHAVAGVAAKPACAPANENNNSTVNPWRLGSYSMPVFRIQYSLSPVAEAPPLSGLKRRNLGIVIRTLSKETTGCKAPVVRRTCVLQPATVMYNVTYNDKSVIIREGVSTYDNDAQIDKIEHDAPLGLLGQESLWMRAFAEKFPPYQVTMFRSAEGNDFLLDYAADCRPPNLNKTASNTSCRAKRDTLSSLLSAYSEKWEDEEYNRNREWVTVLNKWFPHGRVAGCDITFPDPMPVSRSMLC